MTQYSMTPISNGTRRRKDHTTFAEYVEPSVNKGVLVIGDELWEAPADGHEVKKGDKWLKLKSVDGVPVTENLWMAYIHKGVPICNNFKVIEDEGEPDSTPSPEVIYPDGLEIVPLDKKNQPIGPKKDLQGIVMNLQVTADFGGYKKLLKPTFPRRDVGLKITFPLEEAYQVRPDYMRFDHGYQEKPLRMGKPRQLVVDEDGNRYEQKEPMPQTEMTWLLPRSDGGFTPFTKEWQFLYYELLEWAIHGRLEKGKPTGRFWQKIDGKKVFVKDNPYARVEYTPYSQMAVWEDMFSDSVALTDNYAFDNGYADYIQGRNLNAPPMKIKRLLFGNTVVRKIGVDGQYTMIEALDPRLKPPTLQWILDNKPYLIQWTNEIGCKDEHKLPDGRWTVAMFGKFKPACDYFGFERTGVPYFVLGHGGWNLVKTHRLMKLNRPEYSPYVPEK